MTWQELLAYCLAKPGAWQDEPWEGDVVVKVGSKIFAFLGSPQAAAVGLKCGPNRELADEWLLRYPGDASVMAYIGRSGWNSLRIGGAIPDDELLEAIDASYDAVVAKLPKRDRPPAPDRTDGTAAPGRPGPGHSLRTAGLVGGVGSLSAWGQMHTRTPLAWSRVRRRPTCRACPPTRRTTASSGPPASPGS